MGSAASGARLHHRPAISSVLRRLPDRRQGDGDGDVAGSVVGVGAGGAVVGSVVGSDVGPVVGSLVAGSLELEESGGGGAGELGDGLADDGSLVQAAGAPVGEGDGVVAGSTGGASPRIAVISVWNPSSWAEISARE